jgi:hypothetical protein
MEIGPGLFVSDTSTDAWEFDPEVNGDIHVLASLDGFDAGMSTFTDAVDPVTYTPPKRWSSSRARRGWISRMV